jgi:hypothetical protein
MNKKLSEMSIDELQDLLSRVTDPTSASPAEAILQSKTIRFLSSEIAVFKEAICLESRKIHDGANTFSEKLVEIVRTMGATVETLNAATEKAEKAAADQSKQTGAIVFWTQAMVIVIAFQVIVAGFQGWVYYEQLKIMKKTSAHAPINNSVIPSGRQS